MDKRWLAGLLLGCSMAAVAGSSGHRTTMQDAEASMLLTGTINVDPEGAVTGFTIDQRDKVPAGVVQLVDGTVPQWRFEPVTRDGQAVPATTTMSMLVVATRPDPKHYRVTVKGATFGDGKGEGGGEVTHDSMRPPLYPAVALREMVSGEVYLVVRINHLGKVADVAAEQINLRALGSDTALNSWRKVFAESAISAAKRWTFHVPAATATDEDKFFNVRVPVNYVFPGDEPRYGQWSTYIPGPRQSIPWLHLHDMDDWSPPDTLVAGGVYQPGKGLHLLTPLTEG